MNLFELFVKIDVDDQASEKVKNIAGNIGNGLKTAAKVGVAAVGTVSTASVGLAKTFIDSASSVASYGDNIDKMSQKMGLSAQAYQEWDFIMQHSGTSIESLQAGMKTLANAVESGNDAFERLGISQEDIAKMSNEELFSATITALQNVDNETERTYLAGQLLGRGATELGALLNTSAEDVEAMRQQVHELGGVMSDEAVKDAAAYQDSLQNMQTAFSGVQRSLTSKFLPSMVSVMDGLALIFSGDDSGIDLITQGVDDFVTNLVNAVPKIFEVGGSILQSLSTAIISNLPTIVTTAIDVISNFASGILSALPKLLEVSIQIITTIANDIAENIDTAIPQIVEFILGLVELLTRPDVLSPLIQAALAILVAISDGIYLAMTNVEWMRTYEQIILNIFDLLMENLPLIAEAGFQIIVALLSAIVDGWYTQFKSLPNAAQDFADWLTSSENIKPIFEAGKSIINNLWKGLKQAAEWLYGKLEEIVSNIAEKFNIDNIAEKLGLGDLSGIFGTGDVEFNASGIGKVGANAINTINDGISTVANKLGLGEVNLVLPDGTKFAEYLLPDLENVSKARGTPIVQPK